MSFIVSVLLLAVVASFTCAIPGVFLVLRRQSMLVDALSHAVLPGIVLGAIISGTTHSPVMTVLATVFGLVIVVAADKLQKTGLLSGDANQGVVFPAFFALGILLLSTSLSDVHIHTDTVLVGDLNLMALKSEHIIISGIDIGPAMMWVLLGVSLVNSLFLALTYRVMQVSTFDRDFGVVAGLPMRTVETIFMVLIALTIVSAFNVAGAILVIALMVVPAGAAALISNSLPQMIARTLVIAVLSGLGGFLVAWQLDLATTPMMAFFDGLIFLCVLAFAIIRDGGLRRVAVSVH